MKLAIAEQFYSIQGEGRYSGKPAVFLRLAGCNLLCGGIGTEKDKGLHGGATWRCDTIEVWRKGRAIDPEALVEQWGRDGTLAHFSNGAHLVITGGEPLLQQQAIGHLLKLLRANFLHGFVEIETNGTIESKLDSQLIINYNCSPKLKNSGMDAAARAVRITPFDNLDFKFVISSPEDVQEVLDIVNEHEIMNSNVFLMPATDNRETLITQSEMVAKLCMTHHFNFSSRHQVMVWDRTTGV